LPPADPYKKSACAARDRVARLHEGPAAELRGGLQSKAHGAPRARFGQMRKHAHAIAP
jgi:hypothetical protein